MTNKERKILDKEIQYLCDYQDRVKAIREYTGIHPHKTFLNEVETIESLYRSVLENRKQCKSTYFSVGTAGWFVVYLRDKNKYKQGEDFSIKIYHTFVWSDNLNRNIPKNFLWDYFLDVSKIHLLLKIKNF